jgi:hypothetical protein
MLRTGSIKDLELNERRERFVPYLITAAYYLFAFYLLKDFPAPSGMLRIIRVFMLGATGSVVIASIVNRFWKISAHSIAQGGVCGTLLTLCLLLPSPPLNTLYLSIFISGLVGWSRLKLQAHSPAQIYIGFGLGLACTVGMAFFL